ncbi:hypothetical protein ACJEIK_02795 [Mycobacterium sp. SMC-16]|uniref:hypothetical protein n=1 Tax=Mycobacterium sp. SMC-16 TaxID=3385967 RepID=UPI00390C9645
MSHARKLPAIARNSSRQASFVTPAEAIEQRAAGIISTDEMMQSLLSWSYTFGDVARVDGVATDAWIRGDWDCVEMAFYVDKLTDDEFERVAEYARLQLPAAGHEQRLTGSAFTAQDVAAGLELNYAQVHHMRMARQLWAVSDGQSWRFPAAQFDIDIVAWRPIRQISGLADVLAALPADLRPVAIEGFLYTPQPDLVRGRAQSTLAWLRGGGDIDAAVRAARAYPWYGR